MAGPGIRAARRAAQEIDQKHFATPWHAWELPSTSSRRWTAGPGGFTASAVTSVTDTPPTVLVCVNNNVSAFPALRTNGVLCVNTLAPDQREVSRLFSEKVGLDVRFGAARWSTGEPCPILEGAVASFDCKIIDIQADRDAFRHLCEVLDCP